MAELHYTIHGPVIYEDKARNRAYTLKWVGSEPGTAGYLAGLDDGAREGLEELPNRHGALQGAERERDLRRYQGKHRVASGGPDADARELDRAASGARRHRRLRMERLSAMRTICRMSTTPRGTLSRLRITTFCPPSFPFPVGYDGWAPPFRVERIREMLASGKKFDIEDFERMQQDVTSLPARKFQSVLRQWHPAPDSREALVTTRLLNWNAVLSADSREALIYEIWTSKLAAATSREPGATAETASRADIASLMESLAAHPNDAAMSTTLKATLDQLEKQFGPDDSQWQWGKLHKLTLRHPANRAAFNLEAVSRPGDSNTVNATSGVNFQQSSGASFREIIDVGEWDRSVMTNVPGESGDPDSKHYSDLLQDWAAGKYHPMPFTRKAVEAATEERIELKP